jgi:hypothetical protein
MNQNILGTVFASLLNSLWQSAAIALLVWAALRFLPRMGVKINAATRCAAWWAVLAAILILPLAPQRGKMSSSPPTPVTQDVVVQATPAPQPVVAAPVDITAAPEPSHAYPPDHSRRRTTDRPRDLAAFSCSAWRRSSAAIVISAASSGGAWRVSRSAASISTIGCWLAASTGP